MKKKACRVGILLITLILICCLSASVLAISVDLSGSMGGNRYEIEAIGSLNPTSIRASTFVFDNELDDYRFDVYRYVKVNYQYYPDNGSGLEPDTVVDEEENGIYCSVEVSTSTNTNIYRFRTAKFTFRASVTDENGTHDYRETSVEYDLPGEV